MRATALSYGSMFSAPHREAALVGRQILDEGGSAIEAMVAAAAMIAVVYPHMNGIGGDGFWLIHRPGEKPVGIAACGPAAALATPEWYRERGHLQHIPSRGGQAALTVPGTIGGWHSALELVERPMALSRLLGPAIAKARAGIAVSANQSLCTAEKLEGLRDVPGFAEMFLHNGTPPATGALLRQEALAETLQSLAKAGLMSYYTGPIAARHAAFLEGQGSPLRFEDFTQYRAKRVEPLSLRMAHGRVLNMPPPTQGVSSLMILGIYERLMRDWGAGQDHGLDYVHALVEATKQAFILRNRELGDPASMRLPAEEWLEGSRLEACAQNVRREQALRWPYVPAEGDTIWMGAADRDGVVVSFIQSVFWEFGSGLCCPETGVFFQNRGAGFTLSEGPNQLHPGRCPFHTLNPAMAELNDGRIMAYGTMGGEGQPQTQAAVFTRYTMLGQGLQEAVSAPRWLLGRTWGDESTNLKIESRFAPDLIAGLRARGHEVALLPDLSDLCGHAGAVVAHPSGLREGAWDPRSDGAAL